MLDTQKRMQEIRDKAIAKFKPIQKIEKAENKKIEEIENPVKLEKQLLNLEDVKAITGFSTTTIYKYMKLGKFPQSFKYGLKATRWRRQDIEHFLNAQ